ncbi:MAG TPA: RHS repeat-associated core domain-containing protein, partial [Aquabacterium sp.]|nr:RHS repeat-associated core domain-containing protein [Aquabacterium sp.]
YKNINGRSVLASVDGPLANGPKNSPQDSDITRYRWDDRGDYLKGVETSAATSELSYDPAGRLTERSTQSGWNRVQTTVQYADLSSIANAPQLVRTSAWLLSGDQVEKASEQQQTVLQQKFDHRGNVIESVDKAGRSLHHQYDLADRLTEVGTGSTPGQGWRGQLQFDEVGHLRSVGLYKPGQSTVHRASYLWQDQQGRLTQRLMPDGQLDQWTYSDEGQALMHADAQGGQHLRVHTADLRASVDLTPEGWANVQWQDDEQTPEERKANKQQDDFGRVVRTVSPIYGTTISVYDANNRLVQVGRSDGSQQRFEHDHLGRMTQRVDKAAGGQEQKTLWRYEGATLRQIESTQTQSWQADALGRMVGHEVAIHTDKDKAAANVFATRVLYDEHTGLVKSRQLYDGQWLNVERRDAQAGSTPVRMALRSSFADKVLGWMPARVGAWLASWLTDQTLAKDIEITPFDGLIAYTAGNGTGTHWQFDIAGRLTRQHITGVADTRFNYGVGPRIAAMTEAGKAEQKFDYAGWGFLKTAYQPAVQQTLSEPSPQALQMDGAGRVATDGRYQYRYTAQGQLAQVLNAKGQWVAKYTYDAQGQRTAKTVNEHGTPRTTHYLWEQGNLVAEANEQGQLTTQYFYLDEESQGQNKALPIAKWESADSAGNDTGKARLLMIHTDHRGAPIAMTNEDREVVWRGQFNVWGQSTAEHSTQPAHQAAELNLRLPGQYFDAETGLHDNRWRTYNPANGHYLQPDPLASRVGYAQGYNPYLYVGGDPLNRIDPLGLYDVDTHYYTTFFLALVAGVNYEDAKTIATAAQYIDDNPETKPFPSLSIADSWQYERLSKYHFTMWGLEEATVGATTKTYNDSTDLRNYDEIWRAQLNRLEGASNAPGISRCAQLQFFGEYLHAFEDSYGHRDQNNVPITINAGLGHAFYGHEPDKTYNGSYLGAYVAAIGDWDTREQRTL